MFVIYSFDPEKEPIVSFAFQKLRYKEYVERLKFEPINEDYVERDDLEKYSTYLIGISNGEVICGCRLIDAQLCEIPVGKHVKQRLNRNSFEISRYIIDSSIQDINKRRLIQSKLDNHIVSTALTAQKEVIYADMRKALFKLKQLNSPFDWAQIAEEHKHPRANTMFVPSICDLREINWHAVLNLKAA